MSKSVLKVAIAGLTVFVLSFWATAVFQPGTARANQAQPDQTGYLPQPSEWVPVSYDVEFELNGEKAGSRYSMYRNREGSTRNIAMSQGIETNQVDNVLLGKHFRWTTGGPGFVHPLRQRPNNNKPFLTMRKSRVRAVPPSDPRVSHLRGLSVELTFWEFVGSGGARIVYAPELNLLDVYVDMGAGKVKKVTNVVVGEPDASLFQPPSEVSFSTEANARGSGAIIAPPSQLYKKGL